LVVVKLRTRLSLVLSLLLAVSIGITGAILIHESLRDAGVELTVGQRLLAENRAFSIRDNLEILEGELGRLALSPQIDLADDDSQPETRLLKNAHLNSVLYNTAVLLLSETGDCLASVPDRAEACARRFGDEQWFRTAKATGRGPIFRTGNDPKVGRTMYFVQPIVRGKAFIGALVGVIAVDQANVVVSALRNGLPPDVEAMLVDGDGRIVFPTDRERAVPDSDWARAISAATSGSPGTLTDRSSGDESIFAFAPVEASTGCAVILRRPWRVLVVHIRQQVVVLIGVLVVGTLFAALLGILLAAYLTRPLEALSRSAARIALGLHEPAGETRPAPGGEIGALMQAFQDMEQSIRQRDQDLRDAAALLEQRVQDRTRELTAAQQALVEAERFAAMGKTSAAIAHELRNALNGLGMAVELILEDPSNRGRVDRLRTQVLSEIGRLRDVVESLLSFSRSPRIDLKREDLGAVVLRAVGLLSELATERGAKVSVEVPSVLEVDCDGHKIQGVVMNLVKNAVEVARTVKVRAARQDDGVVIEVEDDGPGLSDDATKHLFEPFFTTKPNGTGLGLPTSLRYVLAHGGTLRAGAAEDLGGALFRVALPKEQKRA
jgi:signal transduction histidine kinase